MAKARWANDWTVGIRVWIERHGASVLGQGRAELLSAIGRLHSITKAAKSVGMSYRRAWSLVQETNESAGEPLVEAAVGGIKGGGAILTERGKFALEVYEQVHKSLLESAAIVLQRIVQPSAQECIHLATAISLQEVVGQLLAEYTLRKPAIRIRAVFGASNELAAHVLAGAPCDIFVSAERDEIDRLEQAQLLVANSRRIVAINGLAAIGVPGIKSIRKIGDLLSSSIKHVALAEPVCPLGRYSKAYLETAGVYEELLPKVMHVDNSRAVESAIRSGAAEVGIAFTSDAGRSDTCQTLFRIPASKAAAEYVAAVVRRGEQSNEAAQFLDFLNSPTAIRCFRRCGFRRTK